MTPFADRNEAGQLLAQALRSYADREDVIILALPRGGVPLGLELVRALRAPLDLMLVRKLGVPGHKELAMGAITSDARALNEEVVASCGISDAELDAVERGERKELERRARRYRGDKPWPQLKDRCVILVDDGIATGATMAAAVRAARAQKPAELVLAVPVAPPSSLARFTSLVDRIECLETPQSFWSIGAHYRDFPQLKDEQVIAMLKAAEALVGDHL
ncbi:phosphoribosyltransferase [Microbulbifer thermotolerans]|uniref:Phosphoribosyl transferase n=1 Tax=Microbulbifer thermotolerans TaxID=252514 RepID=A0A143HHN1_MICTH|nr:phosphoribosyltransferase [Microbulbifer thermotolerans]AMX01228.1 phosphoribosyl transferase [Microbulbifer thermotolerans]MCX2778450.1 phosphoribosyltransferase [Microbulbifer thermotolerans]MCX2783920.1 phosphoribosyltransferase [Microbulbifer thermotolerans]MCX2793933.1 phosphoribosyltransferase [Microbulbifer thermotolerans]MCX2802526.1 phosphoribosyltransferase [Microbulbifer thermotolerans]